MMKLEKIIGLTTLSNASIATAQCNSDVFYAAGNCVVRYNVDDNLQKSFYRASNAVACIAVSIDGMCIAAGERGTYASIFVWNIATGQELVLSNSHKHGVGCLAFSPDSQYLVSAGFKHDRQLIVWDWKSQIKVSVQKLGNKVNSLCFNYDGSFFVTCGDRHLKWWYLTNGKNADGSVEVTGKAASILETHKNSIFMDAKIGIDNLVYCVTATGLLCAFDETKYMKLWVQLECRVSYSLSIVENAGADVSQNIVIVGCCEGYIRAFCAKTLQYVATLPLPEPPIGSYGQPAACLAVCIVPPNKKKKSSPSGCRKLAAVYADRSLFIWNIGDINNASQERTFFYHSACIWDVQFITCPLYEDPIFPRGTFVTCSADNTIRIWNDEPTPQKAPQKTENYREMLHIVHISPSGEEHDSEGSSKSNPHSDHSGGSTSSLTRTIADVATGLTRSLTDPRTGIPDLEIPDRPQTPHAPRALAVHPSGKQLVCGDRSGLLRVFDLFSVEQVYSTHAHAAELLTLHYSPCMHINSDGNYTADFMGSVEKPMGDPLVLLASAGRDRLVHVFNASEGYDLVNTLDNHTSPVTAVRFAPDGKRLLSCGADKTMAFNCIDGTEVVCVKIVQTPQGTINGLAIEPSNKFAVTSGQNCRVNIWNLQSGRHVRTYKTDVVKGELYKTDIDPSGMYVAACAFDKTVNLFDFFSGDLVAQVSGHSELITSVRFSPDGRYLLSVGGDGCIMKWSLAEDIVESIQDRLIELVTAHKFKLMRPRTSPHNMRDSKDDVSPVPAPMPMPIPPTSRDACSPPPPPAQSRKGSVRTGGVTHSLSKEASPVSAANPGSAPGDGTGVGVVAGTGAGEGVNRWASRADQQGGYEIFGKKICSDNSEVRKKFTLEVNCKDLKMADLEEEDYVDDDRVRAEEERVRGEEEEKIKEARRKRAEESMDGLENWLEEMLKAETTEPPVEEESVKGNMLNRSLSSKFFENLKVSGGKGPLPPKRSKSLGSQLPAINEESGDTVEALKAQLRNMGVLGATVKAGQPPGIALKPSAISTTESLHFECEIDSNSPSGIGGFEREKERRTRLKEVYFEQEEELRVKAEHCKEVVRELKRAREAAETSFKDLAVMRASVDKTILSSYGQVRDRQMDNTRHSQGDFPYSAAHPFRDDSSDPMESSQVILETDALLLEYQRCISKTGLDVGSEYLKGRDLTDSTGSDFTPTSEIKEGVKEAEILSFLDRYSDRLADMVQQKVKARESPAT